MRPGATAPRPFFRDKRPFCKSQKEGEPFRRSSDLCLTKAVAYLCGSVRLPGFPVTGFRLEPTHQHIQRRYRSGFTPDYLVQLPGFFARAATKRLFDCQKYYSTALPCCQSVYIILPRAEKFCELFSLFLFTNRKFCCTI